MPKGMTDNSRNYLPDEVIEELGGILVVPRRVREGHDIGVGSGVRVRRAAQIQQAQALAPCRR